MPNAFTQLEIEVLRAEVEVKKADVEIMRLAYSIVKHPEANLPRKYLDTVRTVARNCDNEFGNTRKGFALQIERACYGWRREFGEWPTRFNLADRLASETGISRKRAERLIFASINNPDDGCRVHCIRGSLLAAILTDPEQQALIEPWSATGEADLRFYVLAGDAQELPSIEWWTKIYQEVAA